MIKTNRQIALICNLTILGYVFTLQFHLHDFILALLINLIMYVIPGIAWVGVFKDKIKDAVCLLFSVFCLSVSMCMISHVIMLGFKLDMNPIIFIGILTGLTNAGICLTRPASIFTQFKPKKNDVRWIVLVLICIYSCIFLGMKILPEKLDLDGEHQGTAYGIMYELKPYLTSDIIESPYYFAHPPLSNLFNAYSTFLSGRLDDYKYFYDTAKMAEHVLNMPVGQQANIQIKDEIRRVTNFNDKYFMMKQMVGNDMLDSSYTRQGLIEYIAQNDQNNFFRNPRVFPARMSNIYASLFVFLILYFLIVHITQSSLLGILGGLVYVLTPGIYVRSCFSEHVAFTNCLLVLLTYQWIKPKAFDWPGTWGKYCKYWPAVVAGLVNQKIVILIIPIFFLALYKAFKDRDKEGFIRNAVRNNVIPIGFGIGTFLFWAYGFAVDYNAFIISHIKVHLFDRLAHHNTMFAEDYPQNIRLWYEYSREFPLFYVALFSTVICLVKYLNTTMVLLAAWVVTGGVLFSLVDWKQTNHLTQLCIPLLLCLMIYAGRQVKVYGGILKIIVGLALVYCVYFDIQLLKDFSYYIPTSNW